MTHATKTLRTYDGEWIVVDFKDFDRVEFRDCILVYHGGSLRITNSTLLNCDLIGPWPVPDGTKHPAKVTVSAVVEPEVALARKRFRLPRPTAWFWAYFSLCMFTAAIVLHGFGF